MLEKLNLACNIKITEQDEKYQDIHNYIFFRPLKDAIQHNHQALLLDLKDLQDLSLNTDASTIFTKRTKVQNSLLNLLNSHKLFIDILERNHKNKHPKMYARFKKITSHYYDTDFNYRMLEVLRNYCQHTSTIPIDIFSDFDGLSYVFINKHELRSDEKTLKKIKPELESPLQIEFNSIAQEWICTATHIYGLTLDYFAYMAKPVINDYLNQLSTNTMALRADPFIAEIMRSVEIKIIKTRILFPVLPDPELLCKDITERVDSPEQFSRHSKAKEIINNIRKSKNSSRKIERLGIKLDLPTLDTLALKNLNKFMNGEDPF